MKALSAWCYYYYYRAYCRYAEWKYSWKVVISHTRTEITWAMFIPGVNSVRPVQINQGWTWSFLVLSVTQFISNQVKDTLGPISIKTRLSAKPLKHPESQFSMSSISPPSAFIIQKLTIKENLLYFQFVALEEMFESCHLPWQGTTTLTSKEHESFLKVGLRLVSYSTALEDCVLSSNMK